MVPRLHKRGNSFKGALGYVLHDPGKSSSERVGWVVTQNVYSHPDDAWFEMFDTYRNRTALKANAGVDARGRDNKTPVLHYTLAWAASDNPNREHMEAMARDSLKALGLSEHEAVIACHTDKEHHHVHVVVNTVHPYTGKTAALKFSKLEFSRWAEAYEKEHGIHCEERIKNNEKRREIAERRKEERAEVALAILEGKQPRQPAPFEAVNDNSPNRRRWMERKEVTDKMKALRAEADREHRSRRGQTWQRQTRERDLLDRDTRKVLDDVVKTARESYKKDWAELYKTHKREIRELARVATHPFERAVFVFRHRARLGFGKPLTVKQMIPLILSGRKLKSRVLEVRDRDRRRIMGHEQRYIKLTTEHVWFTHHTAFDVLVKRQAAERALDKSKNVERQNEVTFETTKSILMHEAGRRADKRHEERDAPAPRQQKVERAPEPAPDGVPVAPHRVPRATEEIIWAADKRNPRPTSASILTPTHPRLTSDTLSQWKETGVRPSPWNLESVPQVPRQEPPQPEPKQPDPTQQPAAKPFNEVVTPQRSELDAAFKEAAAPRQRAQANEARSSEALIKKEFQKWAQSRRRGDFERER
jgi:hypothetical protein